MPSPAYLYNIPKAKGSIMKLSHARAALAAITVVTASAQAAHAQPRVWDPFEANDIAKSAYIYAFPMVAGYKAMWEFNIDTTSSQYLGGFNQVLGQARVFTPKDTAIVTPNSDTPYSMLQMDLRAEPVVFCVPVIDKARYYSVQLADLYSDTYGYVGSRTTGNDGGCYMVSGPGWHGTKPAAIAKEFHSETQFSLAIFRTQLFNPADIDNIKKIQAGYKAMPLSTFLNTAPPPAAPAIDFPKFGDDAFKTGVFSYLDFLLQFAPTVPEETKLREDFAKIGIGAGKPFDFSSLPLEDRIAEGLAMKEAFKEISARKDTIGQTRNGWQIGAAFGDRAFYNGDYLLRAAAALAGIYGNIKEEALYPLAMTDNHGAKLDGSKANYTLTFPAGHLPPVNAFWSVTMYDGKTQLLIDNPINRYLINSPMLPGMKKNPDGSLTIYIQTKSPGPAKESNWLPAPNGPIYMVMRLYWPKPEALNSTWAPPPIIATK